MSGNLRIDNLSDDELRALVALVSHTTAILSSDILRFGEPMRDPNTPEVAALRDALERRRVLRWPDAPTPTRSPEST
jgi:hypothetical protein